MTIRRTKGMNVSNRKRQLSKGQEISLPVRLQKLLSECNIGSRREIDTLIQQGRIKVNGKVAELGQKAILEDHIQIDGKILDRKQKVRLTRPRVVLYHKPEGVICSSSDPEGRKTVFDLLPKMKRGRWVMVGRLDYNTSGLLLFTTDGDLANRLMHPSYEIEREYAVRVLGEVSDEAIAKLRAGVMLEDGLAKFDRLEFQGGDGANAWYHVILREGKNREVRRMWESVGLTVSRLIRVRFGELSLDRWLSRGKSKELQPDQVNFLRKSVGLVPFEYSKSLLAKVSRKTVSRK